MTNICNGCGEVPTKDHVHQYINPFSNTKMVWCIDGNVFLSLWMAAHYVQEILDCSIVEAIWFTNNLPMKYN